MRIAWNPIGLAIPFLIGIVLVAAAIAEDTVIVRAKDGRGTSQSTGEVIDFDAKQLTLRRADNRSEAIDASRVVDVQTILKPAHRTADELFAGRDYEKAMSSYEEADKQEKRRWVSRRIQAQMIWCARNMGQLEKALKPAMILAQSDPTVSFFEAMPVIWVPETIPVSFERTYVPLMKEATLPEVGRLVLASWFLATPQRPVALAVLEDLADSTDSRIAFWATAQVWRTQYSSASGQTVERWREIYSRMPPSLQAGPAYILGLACSRLKKPQEAALLFMRAPILLPLDRALASQALLAAGQELETMGQIEEARTVYREIVAEHGASAVAATARQRLEKKPP